MSEAPKPGDKATQGSIAHVFLDENYEHCDSYQLAEIMLRNWDVRWKEPEEKKDV